MQRMQTAIVGVGAIGKRYCTLVEQNPLLQLVALCDSVADLSTFSYPVYSMLSDLLRAWPQLKLVIVCSPNGLHCSHTLEALAARCAVLCEKPLAITSADAKAMVQTSQEYNVPLFAVMQNRYSSAVQMVRNAMLQNMLGRILFVEVRCLWNRDDRYYQTGSWRGTSQLDGGVLFTQFSHFVDLLLWLFGDVRVETAYLRNVSHQHNTQFPDSGTVAFSLAEGGMGSFVFSTAVAMQNLQSSITIISEKGSVTIGGQYMNQIEQSTVAGLPCTTEAELNNYHAQLLDDVAQSLAEIKPLAANALDGLRVVQFIEAVQACAVIG